MAVLGALKKLVVMVGVVATLAGAAASAADFPYFRMRWPYNGYTTPNPPDPSFDLALFYAGQPMATAGESYTALAVVTGAQGPTSFRLLNGTLPVGLSLDPLSGSVSGIPLQYGAFSANIQVTDGIETAVAPFVITVVQPFVIESPFAVGSSDLLSVVVGDNAALTFTGRGGTQPYQLNAFTNTPGLTTSSTASFATITGVFTTPGTYSVTATGLDADFRFASYGPVTLHVYPAIQMVGDAPPGYVGQDYLAHISADGGRSPYAYTATGLPPGLSYSAGAIQGVPITAGTYAVQISATDIDGRRVSRSIDLEIDPLPATSFGIAGSLPAAADVGQPLSAKFTPWGGTEPYSLSLSGALPSGLSFDGQAISGMPSQQGTWNGIIVSGTDAGGLKGTTQAFAISVVGPVAVVTASLPNARINDYYSGYFEASGGRAPYSFNLVSGSVPGLKLAADGKLWGMPTNAGVYDDLVVQVTDVDGRTAVGAPATLRVLEAGLSVSAYPPKVAYVGIPYRGNCGALGGVPPYGYAQVGSWPSWLALDASSCALSGTPDVTGSYTLAIQATDSAAGLARTANFAIDVKMLPMLALSPMAPAVGGIIGQPLDAVTFRAAGGRSPYSFALTGQLPAGLAFSSSGVLSGLPTAVETDSVVVTVTDASGAQVSTSPFEITISRAGLVISGVVPAGQVGQNYSTSFKVRNGDGIYSWGLSKGLPDGLSFASAGDAAIIAGTPTQAGTVEGLVLSAADDSGAKGAAQFNMEISSGGPGGPPPLALNLSSVPVGTVDLAYSGPTFKATGGRAPYSFSATGLPPGLSMVSTGDDSTFIAGTPTKSGKFDFTVSVADADQKVDSAMVSIVVSTPLAIAGAPRAGAVGFSYFDSVTASGGRPPYKYVVTSGSLPPGITLDPSAGSLTGRPTTSGDFAVTVTVFDVDRRSALLPFTMSITPTNYVLSGTPPKIATVGQWYSTNFTATGGPGTTTFSLASGSLPDWLQLNATTGVLSGLPSAAGTVGPIAVLATDSMGFTATSEPFSISIADAFVISGALPSSLAIGEAVSVQFSASGGRGPYAYSMNGVLPPGLTLNGSLLAGTPSSVGSYQVTILVSDADGRQTSVGGTMDVAAALSISGSPSEGATVGGQYVAQFTAVGGAGTKTFALASGSLPAWLSLDATSGRLAGTPSSGDIGTVGPLVVSVSDANGTKVSANAFSITVIDATAQASLTSPAVMRIGASIAGGMTSSFASPNWTFATTSAPAGQPALSLVASGSTFSGTAPAVSQITTYTVTATAVQSSYQKSAASFTLKVAPPLAVASSPSGPVLFAVGEALATVGSTVNFAMGALSYDLLQNGAPISLPTLCPGLALNAQGGVSGTPTGTCTLNNLQIRATDAADGSTAIGPSTFAIWVNGPLAIAGSPSAQATVGVNYNALFTATGGRPGYSYSIVGTASDFSVSANGTFTGTPSAAGTVGPLKVRVTDIGGVTADSAPFSIVVLAPVQVTGTPRMAALGEGYSFVPTASGGDGTYSFTVSNVSGTLAALGLAFSGANGSITGQPITKGTWSGQIQAKDGFGRTGVSGTLTVTVTDAIAISPTSGPFNEAAHWVVGKDAGAKFTGFSATGGSGSNVFSVAAGSLPAGVVLNASTGALSGSPSPGSAGNYPGVKVAVTDAGGGVATSQAFTVTVVDALAATGTAPSAGLAGVPYSATFSASGESGSYNWLLTNPPSWLVATPSGPGNNTYTLSGTPPAAGSYGPISLAVTDAGEYRDTLQVQTWTITVGLAPLVMTGTPSLTSEVGQSYSSTFAVTGGDLHYTWTMIGALPPGLTMSGGVISGSPTASGSFAGLQMRVDDGAGHSTTSNVFTITVAPPLVVTAGANVVGAVGESMDKAVATISGGSGVYNSLTPNTVSGTSLGALGLSASISGTTVHVVGTSSGQPSTPGTWTGNFTVTDSYGVSKTSANVVVTVNAALSIGGLPSGGAINKPYSFTPNVSGGSGSNSFTVTTTVGTLAALNLTFDTTTGTIAGTPGATGSWQGTITVKDAGGGQAVSPTFTITVTGPPPPSEALIKAVTGGAIINYGTVGTATQDTDGSFGGWVKASSGFPIVIQYSEPVAATGVNLSFYCPSSGFGGLNGVTYTIDSSTDGTTWTTRASGTFNYPPASGCPGPVSLNGLGIFSPATATYWRFNATSPYYTTVDQFRMK
jgi:hypothetical protein